MHCTPIPNGFMCSYDNPCDCDDNGPIVYSFSNGFKTSLFDACVYYNVNPQMCDEDKMYFLTQRLELNDVHITGASVSCSKCNKSITQMR